jgi:hypothetical protein
MKKRSPIFFNRKTIISGLILIFFGTMSSSACEIFFEIINKEKTVYSVNDTIVVKANVILTHRICPVALEQTELLTNGLKIIADKKWVEVEPGMWEKEIHLLVTGTKSGEISISGIRKCDKDGGQGVLKLKSEPLK